MGIKMICKTCNNQMSVSYQGFTSIEYECRECSSPETAPRLLDFPDGVPDFTNYPIAGPYVYTSKGPHPITLKSSTLQLLSLAGVAAAAGAYPFKMRVHWSDHSVGNVVTVDTPNELPLYGDKGVIMAGDDNTQKQLIGWELVK
jgi:hypothetical protein